MMQRILSEPLLDVVVVNIPSANFIAPPLSPVDASTGEGAPPTTIPAKQLFWCGYDTFVECFFANDFLSKEELAAMLPEEKRGYETAARHQSDCETDGYLISLNVNAYGDRTEW